MLLGGSLLGHGTCTSPKLLCEEGSLAERGTRQCGNKDLVVLHRDCCNSEGRSLQAGRWGRRVGSQAGPGMPRIQLLGCRPGNCWATHAATQPPAFPMRTPKSWGYGSCPIHLRVLLPPHPAFQKLSGARRATSREYTEPSHSSRGVPLASSLGALSRHLVHPIPSPH